VLWASFVAALLLAAVGVWRGPDGPGLALSLTASAILTAFSWLAAASLGPFALALPGLVTALTIGRGLPRTTWAFLPALGAIAAWLLIWTPLIALAGVGGLLVPMCCLVAYAIAFLQLQPAATAG
jgi:hypothetical protein